MDRLERLNGLIEAFNGGPGSGNHGHAGRPGQRGGSLPKGSSAVVDKDLTSPKHVRMKESTCGISGDRTLADNEKVPRLKGLTPSQEKVENEFAQNWEDPKKREKALAEVERQAIEKGNKDYSGTPAFETDGIKQLDPRWGKDSDLKPLTKQESAYKQKLEFESRLNAGEKLTNKETEYYNSIKDTKPLTAKQQAQIDSVRQYRAINNSVLHQTANAVAKKAFENYMDKNPGKEIIVTLGGCASGKGFGLENPGAVKGTHNGKSMTDLIGGKNKVIWDSAGDQGGDEMNWIANVAKKANSKVTVIYTVAPSTASAKNAIVRVQAQGRLVAAQTFNESYTKTEVNYKNFKAANETNPNYTFVMINNPGAGNGSPSIVTKNPYKNVSDSQMKSLIKSEIQDLPQQLRDAANIGADFTFEYK